MSNLPPTLAHRRDELNRSINAAENEIEEREAVLRDLRSAVLESHAELRGIETAIRAYQGSGYLVFDDIQAHQKAARRDIKELVQAELAALPLHPGMKHDEKIRYLCKQLRCKPSQIKAALRAIDKPDNTDDALGQITSKEEQDACYAYPSLTGGLSS